VAYEPSDVKCIQRWRCASCASSSGFTIRASRVPIMRIAGPPVGRSETHDLVGELTGTGDNVEAVLLCEVRPVAFMERVVPEVVQGDDHAATGERRGREPSRVDRAEPGITHDDHQVGVDRVDEVDGVAVGGERRTGPADALDHSDGYRRVRPPELSEELGQ